MSSVWAQALANNGSRLQLAQRYAAALNRVAEGWKQRFQVHLFWYPED